MNSYKNILSVDAIELVHSGEDYFSRLKQIISKAQKEIHLQTYIFINGSTGLEIANALKEAANRNVSVYLLLDGYGSSKLSNSFFNELIKEGIQIRFFSPRYSKFNFYIGSRLHHKVVVADRKVVLLGGINIGNKYRGSITEQPWLDCAIQIENETIAQSFEQLCLNTYFKQKRIRGKNSKTTFYSIDGLSVRILQNDWLKQRNETCNAYVNALRKADREVIIVGSYFLPGRRLSNALKNVSKKGVNVKIILSSVSDLPIVTRATQHLYSSLLKQRVELFEWKKSVLHDKIALIDNKWATIGSFNLNHLSSYGSIEMNVEILSSKFSETLALHLRHIITQCEIITIETFKTRNGMVTRIINWFAYRLVRVALVIVTYIPYKRLFKSYLR